MEGFVQLFKVNTEKLKQVLENTLQDSNELLGRGDFILACNTIAYGRAGERLEQVCDENYRGRLWVCFTGEAAQDPRKNPKDYVENIQCEGCLCYNPVNADVGDCLNHDSKHFGHIESEHACCGAYTPNPAGESSNRIIDMLQFLNGQLPLKFRVVHKSHLTRVTGVGYNEKP